MENERFELVYLESISMYFCERTGLFYSDLYEGRQELSMPQFSITKYIGFANKEYNFTKGQMELFSWGISEKDYNTVAKCFLRLTTRA